MRRKAASYTPLEYNFDAFEVKDFLSHMIHKIFEVKVNRDFVDLQLLILDFETSKNFDKFVSNFCMFLVLNKYLGLQNLREEELRGNQELIFY